MSFAWRLLVAGTLVLVAALGFGGLKIYRVMTAAKSQDVECEDSTVGVVRLDQNGNPQICLKR